MIRILSIILGFMVVAFILTYVGLTIYILYTDCKEWKQRNIIADTTKDTNNDGYTDDITFEYLTLNDKELVHTLIDRIQK